MIKKRETMKDDNGDGRTILWVFSWVLVCEEDG